MSQTSSSDTQNSSATPSSSAARGDDEVLLDPKNRIDESLDEHGGI